MNPVPTRIGNTNTFRYYFTGELGEGEVQVQFIAERWEDSAGVQGEAGSTFFRVINQAPAFEISLDGGLELNAAGLLGEPIIDVRGGVVVTIQTSIDPATGAIGRKFTVDLNGTIRLIELGNVGSAAGIFVLDTGGLFMPDGSIDPNFDPKLWGVLKLEANLAKLEKLDLSHTGMAITIDIGERGAASGQ